MKILIINGPNINMLGVREKEIYGDQTYNQLLAQINKWSTDYGVEIKHVQSNHEGVLVDEIQPHRDGGIPSGEGVQGVDDETESRRDDVLPTGKGSGVVHRFARENENGYHADLIAAMERGNRKDNRNRAVRRAVPENCAGLPARMVRRRSESPERFRGESAGRRVRGACCGRQFRERAFPADDNPLFRHSAVRPSGGAVRKIR